MVPNPEGFMALGGHAAAVTRTARYLAREDGKRSDGSPADQHAVKMRPSRRARLFNWAGDLFLLTGSWLKAQSGLASYEQA